LRGIYLVPCTLFCGCDKAPGEKVVAG